MAKNGVRTFIVALLGLAAFIVPAAVANAAGVSAHRPVSGISRVLLVSVDGLRPDLILRANTPVMRELMARGSYSLWARTTDMAVTLPSHTSMLTGVPPTKHRVDWNSVLPPGRDPYPAWPTLFEIAHRAGYTTGMVAGKSKFVALARPGSLDHSYVPMEPVATDGAVADTAIRWIAAFAPQVLFVHLPSVDTAGHAEGWGSKGQLAAVETADRCIERILDAVRSSRRLDSTLVIVTSDHGGQGKTHGPNDARSRMVPWIAVGPGVCVDVDLTTDADLDVATEDTFATLAYVLGIDLQRPIDGRPVTRIFCAPPQAAQH